MRSVLPAAFLLVGGVALTEEQSYSGSPSSSSETAKLARQHQSIHKQVAADRKASGGKLDASHKQINREQNAPRNIHRNKHSARTQPGADKP
jgi:hypothetical protein